MLNPRVLSSSVLAAVLGLLVGGCATRGHSSPNLLRSSQSAADQLAANLVQPPVAGEGGILVASFVNVDDMTESSSFGRIAAEQIASTLASEPHAFPVIEVRLRTNVFLKEKGGEFLLSREVVDVSKKHAAQAVLVGTYAVGIESVYVSARMVSPVTNQVVSSCDYRVPFDDNTRTLLGYKRVYHPGWWSRLWGGRDVWGKRDAEYYKYYPDYL